MPYADNVAAVSFVIAAGGRDLSPNPPADKYDHFHRFVFYAVLEGCYEDGLIAVFRVR